MRILVVGAGGTGGYFGGRLADAGRDVTFLVRPDRMKQLQSLGLSIRSPFGDAHIAAPRLVTTEALRSKFDLIILSCKSYDLSDAMHGFEAAIGPDTTILPLLNGIAHLETLKEEFGSDRVVGGMCFISAALTVDGTIAHLNDSHVLTFGERARGRTLRAEKIEGALADAGYDLALSSNIMQDMWDKWIFIAATAGMTCLMRSTIGDYVAIGAAPLALQLVEECAAIARAEGYAPTAGKLDQIRSVITEADSTLTTSMLRDIERDAPIESEQIIGNMLKRAGQAIATPMLTTIYAHLKSYEARLFRELSLRSQ